MSNKNLVLYDVKEHVATITLNRPERLNAINDELRTELFSILQEVNNDSSVNVAIIKGSGRAFSVGADLKGGKQGERTIQDWKSSFTKEVEVFRYMLNMDKLIVGQTHGYVLGVGFWLMNACDMVISTDTCMFGVPEIRQATACVLMFMPANVPRNRVFELLTGDFIDGKSAESMGLITRAVPESQIETHVSKFAKKIALIDSVALKMNKQAINGWYRIREMDGILAYEVDNSAVLYGSEGFKKWTKLMRELDLKEYLKIRDGPFKEIDSR